MKATEVTASLAESNGSLLPGLWRDSLYVTCWLTSRIPGSAQGPTLGNEYGKTFTFLTIMRCTNPRTRSLTQRLQATLSHRSIPLNTPSTLVSSAAAEAAAGAGAQASVETASAAGKRGCGLSGGRSRRPMGAGLDLLPTNSSFMLTRTVLDRFLGPRTVSNSYATKC